MKLKGTSKIEIKAHGIVLTADSTEAEIKRAIALQPSVAQFIDQGKVKESK